MSLKVAALTPEDRLKREQMCAEIDASFVGDASIRLPWMSDAKARTVANWCGPSVICMHAEEDYVVEHFEASDSVERRRDEVLFRLSARGISRDRLAEIFPRAGDLA